MTALGQVLATLSVLAVGIAYGTAAASGYVGASIASIIAIVALAVWLVIYGRISAPINARLTGAAQRGETPTHARQLQQRWDSVISARAGLQMLAIVGLCTVLITT